MARHTGSVCRLCRREGLKLYLKGERCQTDRCSMDRRAYPPGQHGQGRKRFSDYGTQLREKQKVKRIYGIMEKQFRLLMRRAEKQKGIAGQNLIALLESRLDNMVYRMGLASSRSEARQLIRHNHFRLNGRKSSIPSVTLKAGDSVEVREKSRKVTRIMGAMEVAEKRGVAPWLELDRTNFRGLVRALPSRDEITMPIKEQLIVEHYSR